LTAIQSFGRPSEIELLVLIDRRFSRNLPIQPDYRADRLPSTMKGEGGMGENNGEDVVYLVTQRT
jgi:pyrimidine operon attenuation protein/uracil phosphoribosyltransferase